MKFLIGALLLAASLPATAQVPVAVSRDRGANGSHILSHEMVVNAPVSEVWEAISSAEGWKSWAVPTAWAPTPDLIETSYTPTAKPDDPSTIKQQILLRIPSRLMVFRTIKAPQGFPDFDTYSKVTSAFELEPLGGDRTRVRLTGAGYADTEAGRRLIGFFEKGNQASLEALAKRFGEVAASLAPSKSLEPLAFLVGHCWRGEFKARAQTDTHCFDSIYGGRHVRDRHEVKDSSGKVTYSGETLYSWDAKLGRVEYTYVASDGGVSRGSMAPKDGALDFGEQRYRGADGKELSISTLWRKSGADSYEAVSRSSANPTGDRVVRYVRID
jgi:uncharacterized protein YndB with AHSA1/START domain